MLASRIGVHAYKADGLTKRMLYPTVPATAKAVGSSGSIHSIGDQVL